MSNEFEPMALCRHCNTVYGQAHIHVCEDQE